MKKIRQPIVTVCGHVDHGKCVSGDTIIPLTDGTLITAKELFNNNYDKQKAKRIDGDIIQEIDRIELFTNYGQIILPKKPSHIWKRKANKLIEIKTAHGDRIRTTPEHPYFKFPGLPETKIMAKDLKEGDYIAVPRQIRIRSSDPKKILFEKLKEKNFICLLNLNSGGLIEKIKRTGINKIEKRLGIKYLADSLRKSRLRMQDLLKLSEFFKIQEDKIYDMIGAIKNSSEKQRAGHTSRIIKLPDFHDPEKIGYVLGCIAGDGHLSKTQVLLDNNDEDIQNSYIEYLKDIFNLNSKIKQNHTCKTIINEGGLTFKRFINEIIGMPDKQKSSGVSVPEIAQKNMEVFRGFFAGLIDTDGYVSHINNSIELTSKSQILIKQCSILLLNFGIQSSVYEKNGFFNLRISNKYPINKFLENFRPRLKRKLRRIISASEKAQSSRIFDIYPISKEIIKKLKLPQKPNKVIPYFNKYIKNQNITRNFLQNILQNIEEENAESYHLRTILEREENFVKVISKREIKNKDKYVYDFTVPGTHNFIAERTILHNTSILDCLRSTSVQEGEMGGITQKISFTLYPMDQLKKACPLIEKSGINLDIPGFLLIDTPGHAAFTNLRKRGGSLADLAVLVIDINEGIKPQTAEVIQILKHNKTPFIIALNKIDNISGWRTPPDKNTPLKENIESQSESVQNIFMERYMTIMGALNSYGFDSDLYYNIDDFTKKISLVPTSARTTQGIPELIMMLCGLSQKFLSEKLKLGTEAKGVMLEIKKDKNTSYIEAILYDGQLSKTDEIAIANFDVNADPITTKIRVLEEIKPLSSKFGPKDSVTASTGIRMQLIEKENILPGMPFEVHKNNLDELKQKFKKEISENINSSLEKKGIIIKADSLGSLEALMTLLKQSNVPILKAGIGNINKADIISAKANLEIDELNSIIVGFNVSIDEDAKELMKSEKNIKALTNEVVYKLIEELEEWRKQKQNEIEKKRLMELATICKLEILHQYVFRNTSPAIFGVRIVGGKLTKDLSLIDESGNKIGKTKAIQHEKKSVDEASEGQEVALSISNINFERVLGDKKYLYTDLGESQFRKFKKNKDLLSQSEKKTLQEIAEIKRSTKDDWGM